MKLFILSGSHRSNSESLKVAKYMEAAAKSKIKCAETFLYSLEKNPLPLWDEGVWTGAKKWADVWTPIKKQLSASDAFIIVTPEWGGMASPGVKNFMLLASGEVMAYKPGMLVSVSGSQNGAYPIAEMRMTSTKNSYLTWIPEHIIVRDVKSVLNDGAPFSDDDTYLRGRIDYSLLILEQFSIGMEKIRKSGVLDLKTYPFGM